MNMYVPQTRLYIMDAWSSRDRNWSDQALQCQRVSPILNGFISWSTSLLFLSKCVVLVFPCVRYLNQSNCFFRRGFDATANGPLSLLSSPLTTVTKYTYPSGRGILPVVHTRVIGRRRRGSGIYCVFLLGAVPLSSGSITSRTIMHHLWPPTLT